MPDIASRLIAFRQVMKKSLCSALLRPVFTAVGLPWRAREAHGAGAGRERCSGIVTDDVQMHAYGVTRRRPWASLTRRLRSSEEVRRRRRAPRPGHQPHLRAAPAQRTSSDNPGNPPAVKTGLVVAHARVQCPLLGCQETDAIGQFGGAKPTLSIYERAGGAEEAPQAICYGVEPTSPFAHQMNTGGQGASGPLPPEADFSPQSPQPSWRMAQPACQTLTRWLMRSPASVIT